MRYLICGLLLVSLGNCKVDDPKDKTVFTSKKNGVQDTLVVAPDSLGFKDKIFDFSLTNDPKFCNSDSLVEGDCNNGFLYFTTKGNVIYNYICLGNTEEFCIGKAVKTAKGIALTFDRCYMYSFSEEYENVPTNAEINSGKMEQMKPFTLHLEKLACKDAYSFVGGVNGPEYYIVTETKKLPRQPRLEKDFLLRTYKKIGALRNL